MTKCGCSQCVAFVLQCAISYILTSQSLRALQCSNYKIELKPLRKYKYISHYKKQMNRTTVNNDRQPTHGSNYNLCV